MQPSDSTSPVNALTLSDRGLTKPWAQTCEVLKGQIGKEHAMQGTLGDENPPPAQQFVVVQLSDVEYPTAVFVQAVRSVEGRNWQAIYTETPEPCCDECAVALAEGRFESLC